MVVDWLYKIIMYYYKFFLCICKKFFVVIDKNKILIFMIVFCKMVFVIVDWFFLDKKGLCFWICFIFFFLDEFIEIVFIGVIFIFIVYLKLGGVSIKRVVL